MDARTKDLQAYYVEELNIGKERKGRGRNRNGERMILRCDKILLFGKFGERAYRESLFYNFLYI